MGHCLINNLANLVLSEDAGEKNTDNWWIQFHTLFRKTYSSFLAYFLREDLDENKGRHDHQGNMKKQPSSMS